MFKGIVESERTQAWHKKHMVRLQKRKSHNLKIQRLKMMLSLERKAPELGMERAKQILDERLKPLRFKDRVIRSVKRFFNRPKHA